MNDHTGRLVRNTVLYLPAQFLPPLVQFLTVVVWTYQLAPAGFGIVTFVIAAQEFTSIIGVNWWTLFVLRFRLRYQRSGEERFRRLDSLIVSGAILTQIALTVPMLWLGGATIGWMLFVSAAGFFISRTVFAHYCEWARADRLIGVFTAAQLVGSVGGSLLSIAALHVFGPHPSAALSAQALGFLMAIVVLFSKARLKLRSGRYDPEIFAEAKRYSAPLIPSGIAGWVAMNCIRVLVQFSEGASGLGLLSVGWGLGQRIATVLAMLFAAATYPLAVRNMEDGNRQTALGQISLNAVFLLTMLAPTCAGAAIMAPYMVNLLIAERFRAVTIIILPIALLVAAIRSLRVHTADQTMILVEHTRASMFANIVEAVASAAFCAIGLHYAGVVGAALGVLCGSTIAAVLSFGYAFIRLDLPFPSIWTIARILGATGLMFLGLMMMPAPVNIAELVFAVLAGAVAYAILILVAFSEARAAIRLMLSRRVARKA